MQIYRTLLVWLLRLVALGQIALAIFMLMPTIAPNGGAISGPIAVVPREPIEQAIAIAVGPLVCLAVAEVLALLNGNRRTV